jgi:hypothetical protein
MNNLIGVKASGSLRLVPSLLVRHSGLSPRAAAAAELRNLCVASSLQAGHAIISLKKEKALYQPTRPTAAVLFLWMSVSAHLNSGIGRGQREFPYLS